MPSEGAKIKIVICPHFFFSLTDTLLGLLGL